MGFVAGAGSSAGGAVPMTGASGTGTGGSSGFANAAIDQKIKITPGLTHPL